jgi:hypothetical protein
MPEFRFLAVIPAEAWNLDDMETVSRAGLPATSFKIPDQVRDDGW